MTDPVVRLAALPRPAIKESWREPGRSWFDYPDSEAAAIAALPDLWEVADALAAELKEARAEAARLQRVMDRMADDETVVAGERDEARAEAARLRELLAGFPCPVCREPIYYFGALTGAARFCSAVHLDAFRGEA